MVWAARFMSHLKFEWDNPVWHPWIEMFSRRNTLIRYDGRGCGLSDREKIEFSLDSAVEDLAAVVEATGVRKFVLLGISSGGAIAMTYAARRPERISYLVLHGAYMRGHRARSLTKEQRADADIQLRAIQGWSKENEAFRQLYTSRWIPDASLLQSRSFNELIRQSTTPEVASRLMEVVFDLDVRGIPAQIGVPTLVTHSRSDDVVPFNEGRMLAGLIPSARFVPLESRNHLLLENEAAFSQLEQELDLILSRQDR